MILEEKFIRNVLDVNVDALNGIVKYTITAMYDEIDEEGIAEIIFKPVDEFELTWSQIQEKGGSATFSEYLKERYKIK